MSTENTSADAKALQEQLDREKAKNADLERQIKERDDADQAAAREAAGPTVDEQTEAQLEAGKVKGAEKAAANAMHDATAAEQRAGVLGAVPTEGRVDNMTRRDDNDVLQGHFCTIDFSDKDHGKAAKEAVERIIGEGNARAGSGDYGVYTDPGTLDPETGYPLTANVLLRDEHSALIPSVPYGALRPASQGGRR